VWHRGDVEGRAPRLGLDTRGLSLHALVIGGYVLLTVILTYPVVLHLTSHVPDHDALDPGVGDSWVFMWAFGFMERLVMESRHWSLFTDALFYPRGLDLTYPMLFGVGFPLAVSIPLVHFLGIILTYNLFVLGSFILTAYTTFLLVRDLTKDSRAAFIAGVIFAFSPYHMAHSLNHLNLATSGMWIPLYIIFFIRAVRGGRVLGLVAASLVFTFTLLSNLYYAIFLVFFTIIYTLYHIISKNEPIVKSILLKRVLSIGCIALLFLLPLVWIIFAHGWRDFHVDLPISESFKFSADLLAFFVPSAFHPLWGNLVRSIYYYHFTGNDTEQTVYLGYIVIGLSLVAVLKAPKAKTRFWTLSALAFFMLSLGPVLHINGKSTLKLNGMPITFPLPNLLLYFIPLLNTLRAASRFAVMLMLALAVLAGYGTQHLLKRLEGRSVIGLLFLGLIVTTIAFEFLSAPFPLVDARMPKVYERIAAEGGEGGTVLDVPLHWALSKYEYYQTTHRKRLLLGQVPRLSMSLLTTYADSLPFMKLFKNPELIHDYEEDSIEQRDILRFIEFFDLSFIVIHKELLGSEIFDQFEHFGYIPRGSIRLQAPEVSKRLMRFLLARFPINHMEEEGNLIVLQLARNARGADLWEKKNEYIIDFGATAPQFFLFEGWWPPERWRGEVFSWSNAKMSQLWVRFPQPEDFVMELRLRTFPSGPPQGVTIYANERLLDEVQLETAGWHLYTVHVPKTALTTGLNGFRFVYRYTTSPAEVFPGNEDDRKLAVAFDFIRFREGGNIVALEPARSDQSADLWEKKKEYIIDFGSTAPQFFLSEGWWVPERKGELTFAWSDAKMSQLWVRFPQPEDFVMELRLLAFPSGPPQGVTIYANKRLLGEVQLETAGWHLYTVHVPKTALTTGLNGFRFVYHYTTSPAEVFPGNEDGRRLAVAFNFIRFRAE
jgi:hypothetical protein